MDGEVDGAQTQGEEQQGVQGDEAVGVEQSGQAEEVGGEGCRSVRAERASRRPRGGHGDAQEGEAEQFGYAKAADGKNINWMVVEKSAVIKFDKHVASRVFSPDELENLDSYMRKYRKYGIVELLDNKLDGVRVSVAV